MDPLQTGFHVTYDWTMGFRSDGAQCFICKRDVESVVHFILDCLNFGQNVDSIWNKLKSKITN